MPLIVIPEPIEDVGIDLLGTSCEVEICTHLPPAERRVRASRADGLIVRSFKVDAALIAASPRLGIVSKHGAGFDNIDVAAASAAGIVVTNVPGGNALAVAEGAVALMLAALRRVPAVHRLVTQDYAARLDLAFGQLSDRTLGLVGLGAIGRHVARICSRGFDMKVLAYDPYVDRASLEGLDITLVPRLDDMIPAVDVLSLHIPLAPETRHLIGRERLGAMRPGAVLVNTARGPLVDPDALQAALAEGRIAGAALDVFETEPPPPGHPLFTAPNLVLSPHVAGSTVEANRTLALQAARNVIDTLGGVRPVGLINAEAWEGRRRPD